jgi:DNA primase
MIDLLARLKGVRACGRDRWTAMCPAHDDHDPSLSVAHRDRKWLVHCFASCSIETITSAIGLTIADLFDDAPPHPRQRTLGDLRRGDARHEDERAEKCRRMDAARRIWRAARPGNMAQVDAYLASRCLVRPLTGHIRFHAGVWHKQTGREWSAMVWLISDGVTAKPLGVHVTYLDDAGVSKAPITLAKKTFGLIRGGVIRLTPPPPADSGKPLILAEGLETALSALSAGYAYVWAAISSGNMKVINLPEDIRAVIIVADMDEDGGMAAARILAHRLSQQGRNVRIAQPPRGLDLNDLLTRKAAEEVAA